MFALRQSYIPSLSFIVLRIKKSDKTFLFYLSGFEEDKDELFINRTHETCIAITLFRFREECHIALRNAVNKAIVNNLKRAAQLPFTVCSETKKYLTIYTILQL